MAATCTTIYLQRPDVQQAYPNLRGDGLAGVLHTGSATAGALEHQIPDRADPEPAAEWRPPATPHSVCGGESTSSGTSPPSSASARAGGRCSPRWTSSASRAPSSTRRAHRTGSAPRGPAVRRIRRTSTSTSCASTATRRHGSWSALRRVFETISTRLACGRGSWRSSRPRMLGGVPYVDEVWTNSWHAVRSIGRASTCLSVMCRCRSWPCDRSAPTGRPLRIDAGFTFLFCFDVHSIIERKNPIGSGPCVSSGIRSRRGTGVGRQVDQRRLGAHCLRTAVGRCRWALGHPPRRSLPRHVRQPSPDRRLRLLCVVAPRGGVRVHDGRGDARREAGHRHGLLWKSRVHERVEQFPRRLHARAGTPWMRALSRQARSGPSPTSTTLPG